MDKVDIEKALEELEKASESYKRACQNYEQASRGKTAALNKMNEAQREFDAAVEKMKGQVSGRDTDWWNQKHRPKHAQSMSVS